MRSTETVTGRRVLLVLDDGDDVLSSIAETCRQHGIERAVVPLLLGAFRTVTLIGTDGPVSDAEAPLPESVSVSWAEGIGSATVAPDADGETTVHLHATVGDKLDSSRGFSGHVLAAIAHYTVEIVIDELLAPALQRLPDPAVHGLPSLRW